MSKIFLHFLNRELLRSVGQKPPANFFDSEIKTLCIGTDALLFSNFANTIEGNYLQSDLYRELVVSKLLHFYGEKQNIEEFWATRGSRYFFDKNRYPYLTETINGNLRITPFIVRDFSMTDRLKVNLFDHVKTENQGLLVLNPTSQKEELKKVLKKLALHEGAEAMTMSLASTFVSDNSREVNKTLIVNNSGKVLAYYYLKEILSNLGADMPTGVNGLNFFDSLSQNFPSYDCFLLFVLINVCGFKVSTITIDQIVEFRYSIEQQHSVTQINHILYTLSEIMATTIHLEQKRAEIYNVLIKNSIPPFNKSSNLKYLPMRLNLLNSKLISNQPLYREISQSKELFMKTIVILTATTKESKAVLKLSAKFFSQLPDASPVNNHVVSFLGIINSHKIYHAQCEAGSVGPSSSQAVANDLIAALKPIAILMPGIAFGLQSHEQKIGDILVSTHVCAYERQRVGKDETIHRGETIPSSPLLLSLLRTVSHSWDKSDMHFGVIMSGEKLVDNPELVAALKKVAPEAIGGEMEGAGLFSSAHRNKVDWIIFKSIVDWGMGKTNEFQAQASSLASEVLFEALPILTK